MRIALFEPDIPQNAGTILRLAACLGVGVDIIEPTGFPSTDKAFRRAGMDYLDHVELRRHISWQAFETWRAESGARLILATTKGDMPYTAFAFRPSDIILMGRESAGAPAFVHEAAQTATLIEALRQTDGWPAIADPENLTPASEHP